MSTKNTFVIFRDQFPDNNWLKNQIETDFKECRGYYDLDDYGWPTVLINSTGNQTGITGIKGPFSIFFNKAGKSSIKIDTNRTTIYDTSFVVANKEQVWDIEIPKQAGNHNVVLNFGEILFSDAIYYLKQQDQTLLDYPNEANFCLPDFNFGSVYKSRDFDLQFEKICAVLQYPTYYKQLKEEAIFNFIEFLFNLLNVETCRKDRLKSIKFVTRSEILNRLHSAIELMHSEYEKKLSLQELASASCLSKFHFLKCFKDAYGITPLQYIQKIRIEKAIDLLRNSTYTVQEIAESVGFENGNSLSRIMTGQTSFPPTWYRSKISNIG